MYEAVNGVGTEADERTPLFGRIEATHLRSSAAQAIFNRCGVKLPVPGHDAWDVPHYAAEAIKACGG